MSWHYLPELVGESLEASSLGGAPSVRSKSTHTDGKCFSDASGTACYPCSRSGTTSRRSMDDRGVALWMSSLAASRARISQSEVLQRLDSTVSAVDSGARWSESFAKLDPVSHSWKTRAR